MPRLRPEAFVPLKSNWFHILICLVEGEQHGYGIMQDVLERTEGKVRLWPATLYGSLKRLIEAGSIVESGERPTPEFDDARRRSSELTANGPACARPRESATQGPGQSPRRESATGGALMSAFVIACSRLYRGLGRAFPREFRAICGDGLEQLGEDVVPQCLAAAGCYGDGPALCGSCAAFAVPGTSRAGPTD